MRCTADSSCCEELGSDDIAQDLICLSARRALLEFELQSQVKAGSNLPHNGHGDSRTMVTPACAF